MSQVEIMRIVRHLIVIGVGTVYFLLFCFLCFYRELGPVDEPSEALFGVVMFLGAITLVFGLVVAGGRGPAERGFGIVLAVEGGLLLVLSLVAFVFMGQV